MGRVSLVSKYNVDGLLDDIPDRQKKFVLYYVESGNGLQSALKAGYAPSSASVTSAKLLKNPNVITAIGELQRRMMESQFVTAEDTLRQLGYLITRSLHDIIDPETGLGLEPHEIRPEAAAAIDGYKEKRFYDREGSLDRVEREYKFSPKAAAVDMGLKKFAMYAPEKLEVAAIQINAENAWKLRQQPDEVEQRLLAEANKKTPKKKPKTPPKSS